MCGSPCAHWSVHALTGCTVVTEPRQHVSIVSRALKGFLLLFNPAFLLPPPSCSTSSSLPPPSGSTSSSTSSSFLSTNQHQHQHNHAASFRQLRLCVNASEGEGMFTRASDDPTFMCITDRECFASQTTLHAIVGRATVPPASVLSREQRVPNIKIRIASDGRVQK
jgi:shikimate kinase